MPRNNGKITLFSNSKINIAFFSYTLEKFIYYFYKIS